MPFYSYDVFMTARKPEGTASLPIGSVWAPRLERAENGRLHADTSAPWLKKRAPLDLLDRFIRIAEAPASRRLEESKRVETAATRFASQWGLLQLCEHGLPIGHAPGCNAAVDEIEHYKQFALCLEALRRIGLEISNAGTGDDIDWELADVILCGPDFPPRPKELRDLFRKYLKESRAEFQTLMRLLVERCRLQPRFQWDGTAWSIDFDCLHGSNLAAILTVQLMSQLGGKAMRKCRECPRWFQPSGRQVYCKKCGIRPAWRAASRRQREKRKSGK